VVVTTLAVVSVSFAFGKSFRNYPQAAVDFTLYFFFIEALEIFLTDLMVKRKS
jgi:hypothetical protein